MLPAAEHGAAPCVDGSILDACARTAFVRADAISPARHIAIDVHARDARAGAED